MDQHRYRFTPDVRYPVLLQCVGSEILRLHPEVEQRLMADAARGGRVFERIGTEDDYLQAVAVAATDKDRERQQRSAATLLALIYGETHDSI